MHSFPKSLRQTTLVLGAIALIALASGCRRVSHIPDTPPGPVLFLEIEPNDSPDFPDFVAVLNSSSFLAVRGSVEAVGFDIVDHIEFEANQPIEVDFYLEALSPFGDVDVSIYDPIDNVIVGTYAFSGPSEFGTIVIHEPGRPFQFVIEAFDSNTVWDLELTTYPSAGFLTDGPGEPSPDGIPGESQAGLSGGAEESDSSAPLQQPGTEGLGAEQSQADTKSSVRPWIEIRSRN